MKYMCLLYSGPPATPDPMPGTPEFAVYMEPWEEVNRRFVEDGILVGGEALMPPETATRVRLTGDRVETMDGPYAETKEQLGGYFIIDCADLDAAIRYAAMIPTASEGTVELRPIMDLDG